MNLCGYTFPATLSQFETNPHLACPSHFMACNQPTICQPSDYPCICMCKRLKEGAKLPHMGTSILAADEANFRAACAARPFWSLISQSCQKALSLVVEECWTEFVAVVDQSKPASSFSALQL